MDRMPEVIGKINLQEALELLHKLAEFLNQARETGIAAHEVEGKIFGVQPVDLASPQSSCL